VSVLVEGDKKEDLPAKSSMYRTQRVKEEEEEVKVRVEVRETLSKRERELAGGQPLNSVSPPIK
jgi:hypothetical protein